MAEQGYAKGRLKRRAIIDQASALFAEVGYRSASLREIAARSGLSHPGLLHHFPTKEALLLAVLEQRDADDDELMTAPSADGLSTLRGLVTVVERNVGRRGIVELFTILSAEATAADHTAHDFFDRRYRTSIERIEAAYAQLADRRLLRSGLDPNAAARQIIALLDGLQVQWLLDDRVDMVGAIRSQLDGQILGGLDRTESVPVVRQTVLDCPDARSLAEYYRELLGLRYRRGDEPGEGPEPDWLVLRNPMGPGLAFQQIDDYVAPTWPAGAHPQMLHLDTTVDTVEALFAARDRAVALGGRELLDRSDDADEPLFVVADPVGHPFCVFVS